MDETQKKALRSHWRDLTHSLTLTPDLIANLIQHGLFKEDTIEEIKAEKVPKEGIQKLLRLVTKRGPHAFDKFIEVIEDAYPWLSEKLRSTHSSLKTEPERRLKSVIESFVHESFGNSRRFSEKDKHQIKQFLYKHLISQGKECDLSMQTSVANKTEIEKRIVDKVRKLLFEQTDTNDVESSDTDSSTDIYIEEIANKVKELHQKIDSLQNEINNCYEIIGLKHCEYPLHDILQMYKEKRDNELIELNQLKEKIDILEQERQKLEDKLIESKHNLNENINCIANIEHENEKYREVIKDLRTKYESLEKVHDDYVQNKNAHANKNIYHKFQHPVKHQSHSVVTSSILLPNVNRQRHGGSIKQSEKGKLLTHTSSKELPKLHHKPHYNGTIWKFY